MLSTAFVIENRKSLCHSLGRPSRSDFVQFQFMRAISVAKLVDCAMSALDKEGINKVALVAFKKNDIGNDFWESIGFAERDDLVYRNKNIHELNRIDT